MKKSAKILAAALAVVIILIIGIWIYYNQVLERSGISETSTNTYQWHYVKYRRGPNP